MANVRNARVKNPILWIPPDTTATFKITVEESNGTVRDITNFISSALVEDYVTDSIGRFEYTIMDPNGTYRNIWSGNEIFRYYKDYAATATTLRFRGRLEKPSNRTNKLFVRGRREDVRLLGVTVTKQFDNIEAGVIIKTLFSYYAPEFTVNNINTTNYILTKNWYQKPFFECIREICTDIGWEFYVDPNLDAHFFESGSVDNTTDAMVHEFNIIDVNDFTPDLTQVRNRVIVYGAIVEGIQILYTAESDDADYGVNSDLGVRELIINDNSITSYQQAKDIGDNKLLQVILPPQRGAVKSWILATLQPGQNLNISSPQNNIPPGMYITGGYKDTIDIESSGTLLTEAFILREPRTISNAVVGNIRQSTDSFNTTINPFEQRYAYNFNFNDTTEGTRTNVTIADSVVKLTTAGTGSFVSAPRTLDKPITQAYLIVTGTNITDAKIEVSGNGGVSYQTLTNRQLTIISSASGTSLVVKCSMTDVTTEVNSISVLYSTS